MHGVLPACQCWTLASVNVSDCNGNHCSSKAEVTMTNGAAVRPAGCPAALEGDHISLGSSLMHNTRLVYFCLPSFSSVCFPFLRLILILLSQLCCRKEVDLFSTSVPFFSAHFSESKKQGLIYTVIIFFFIWHSGRSSSYVWKKSTMQSKFSAEKHYKVE